MRISDQTAAIKLAICDDIGERSYGVADIAAILVQMLARLPSVGMYHVSLERNKLLFSVSAFNLLLTIALAPGIKTLNKRYKMDEDGHCGKTYESPWFP